MVKSNNNLDIVLYEWFWQQQSERISITGLLLQKKAHEFHVQLEITDICHNSKI